MTVHEMCAQASTEQCNSCGSPQGQPCQANCYHLARFAQAVGHAKIGVDDFAQLIPNDVGFTAQTLIPDVRSAADLTLTRYKVT